MPEDTKVTDPKGLREFEPPTKRFTNHPTQRECGHIRIIYKPTAIAQGTGVGKRDLALSQAAFYAGARRAERCWTT